jgi:hypothetical protein
MAEVSGATDIAKRRVVYELRGGMKVSVRHDIPYRTSASETLTFDLYRPADTEHAVLPVVLFITGFSDVGMRSFVGCNAKDMQCYKDWAHLIAASGLAAITYTTTTPESDVYDLLHHLRTGAGDLGIDADAIGLWACSGNVPNALGVLMNPDSQIRCAAFCYGFMLDLDGTTHVAEASAMFRFRNPAAGKSINDIPRVPLLIARAGRDEMPHLNDSIDVFARKALEMNLPITLINHSTAPHAFDLMDDSDSSRNVIGNILGFLRLPLAAPM